MDEDANPEAAVLIDHSWDDGIAVLKWSDGTVDELWCSSATALQNAALLGPQAD